MRLHEAARCVSGRCGSDVSFIAVTYICVCVSVLFFTQKKNSSKNLSKNTNHFKSFTRDWIHNYLVISWIYTQHFSCSYLFIFHYFKPPAAECTSVAGSKKYEIPRIVLGDMLLDLNFFFHMFVKQVAQVAHCIFDFLHMQLVSGLGALITCQFHRPKYHYSWSYCD